MTKEEELSLEKILTKIDRAGEADYRKNEELNKLADAYVKEGKIEPGEYDRETLKSKVLDSIVEEYKSTDIKENTAGRTL